MSSTKDWVDITAALLTPVIAVGGVVIAGLQWRLSNSKFKFDIFDKRYKVFEATQRFIGHIIATAEVDEQERINFLRDTKIAFAIYDAKVTDYLKLIHDKSLELRLHQSKKNHDKESQVLTWFTKQLENHKEQFERQLKI
ncbi:hypothetical protein ACOLNO_004833 [Vibrio parahaemolyticus]|nr:hypothetical protein [Vibrio parahaemolyticus]EGQ9289794.1 hypothetical protein [Vibrio parahaemolyticus]